MQVEEQLSIHTQNWTYYSPQLNLNLCIAILTQYFYGKNSTQISWPHWHTFPIKSVFPHCHLERLQIRFWLCLYYQNVQSHINYDWSQYGGRSKGVVEQQHEWDGYNNGRWQKTRVCVRVVVCEEGYRFGWGQHRWAWLPLPIQEIFKIKEHSDKWGLYFDYQPGLYLCQVNECHNTKVLIFGSWYIKKRLHSG